MNHLISEDFSTELYMLAGLASKTWRDFGGD
jgi:hypothetical protein